MECVMYSARRNNLTEGDLIAENSAYIDLLNKYNLLDLEAHVAREPHGTWTAYSDGTLSLVHASTLIGLEKQVTFAVLAPERARALELIRDIAVCYEKLGYAPAEPSSSVLLALAQEK